MNGKRMNWLVGVISTILIGCANEPVSHSATMVAPTATEQILHTAFNAARRNAGQPALESSPVLVGLAQQTSADAAATGLMRADDVNLLRSRTNFGTVVKLQGRLLDHGPQTGASFVRYWASSQREMVLDGWSQMGVGVTKSADGHLFGVVLLGRAGSGGSLMNPGMAPRGF